MTVPAIQLAPLARFFTFRPRRDLERGPRSEHILEHYPAAAFLIFGRTRLIVAVNGQAVALTEWTREELTARRFSDIAVAPSGAEVLAQSDTLERGSVRQVLGGTLRARSGREIPVDLRLSAYEENGEIAVLALATPVEDRLGPEREAAQQARALEVVQHLLTLYASPTEGALAWAIPLVREMLAADSVGLYRIVTSPLGLRLEHTDRVPPEFPKVLGPGEAHELLSPMTWAAGRRVESYLHRALRAAGWIHFIAHPIGEASAAIGVLFAAYRPGSTPPAQAQGWLAVAARQIQHLMIQILREANLSNAQNLAMRLSGRLAAINAQIEEGVVIVNYAGTIDEINGAAARMLGYRSEDVIGLPFDDVLISDGPLPDAIRTSLSGGLADTLQDKLRRRDGQAFPVVAGLRPLPECGCVITLRDQSEMRSNELRREHLDHLAYVGQSTESFAHEVRGPLNNIAMGVQYLAARLPPDDAWQVALGKIQAECKRLSDLMNDMLAWAKPLDPRFEPTALAALLTRLLNRWSTKIQQQNVRLNFIPGDCPRVMADPRLIERVYVNLIENALQAMPAGGDLSVALRTGLRGPQGVMVETRIGDSGSGIPEEVKRRIFDPYFTTKPDGTGLGLAMCKRLVTIHRGAISVESFPASGTIFTVTLPAHDASFQPPSPETLL
jgi:two-component system nitrogen regulation sensor histidine kinase GlnL